MIYTKGSSLVGLLVVILLSFTVSCKNKTVKQPPKTDITSTPEELGQKTSEDIKEMLDFAASNNGNTGDSSTVVNLSLLQQVYSKNGYQPIWNSNQKFIALSDSILRFVKDAKLSGLFPDDYHYPFLDSVYKLLSIGEADKAKKDAVLWARTDLFLTDAFFHVITDLKLGRLPKDSVTLRKDSVLADDFYLQRLAIAQKNNSLALVFHDLEPVHYGYQQLKAAIPAFLANVDTTNYTVVPSPKSGPGFKRALQTRLYQGGYLTQDSTEVDSTTLSEAVRQFQEQRNITADGKAGEGTVRVMNMNDKDRFIRIAITMDRYKLLPEKMPDRFVWVNLPSFHMKLREGDSTKIVSKIICGKPITRTPLLTSAISDMITYPQWTIPTSIIAKEILPAVKKNPGYLAKKGFSLIDSKGEEVDPYSVDWTKYKKGIPYKVVQGSGDANALGVLKFNFPNKYAVYLHDTNQRSLFANTNRSLSHGCVRVQDWSKLALSIIRYDQKDKKLTKPSPVEDSLNAWLERKEKHSILVRNRLPVYIRYFTCDTDDDNRIVFYDDIYGEDKYLQAKYFAGK
jgi:murein L,D-transpeptidase YcbB/YkuD